MQVSEPDSFQQPDEREQAPSVDPETERAEDGEARAFARLGGAAVPVAVAHLVLIFVLLKAAFGFELPAFLPAERVVAWLWVNGAAVGLGVWMWRKGRVPLGGGRWLGGRRARMAVLAWLALSLAWVLLPALLGAAWRVISQRAGGW